MEFKMKKRTLRSIALVLVFCLVIPSFFAMAGAADVTKLEEAFAAAKEWLREKLA